MDHSELSKIARDEKVSFDIVSSAASELAKQGLSSNELLKRLKDSIALFKLTGLDPKQAVISLTSATKSPKSLSSFTVESDGNPLNTFVSLDGLPHNLGHIQKIEWSVNVGEMSKCVIHTILTPAKLKVLAEDTTIKYRLVEDLSDSKS